MKLACPLKLLSFSLLSIGLLLGSLAEGAGPRETEEAGTRITKTRTTRTTRPRIIIHSSNTNSKTQIKLLHQGKGSLINNSKQHQQPIIISNSNDINKDEIEGPTTNHKKGPNECEINKDDAMISRSRLNVNATTAVVPPGGRTANNQKSSNGCQTRRFRRSIMNLDHNEQTPNDRNQPQQQQTSVQPNSLAHRKLLLKTEPSMLVSGLIKGKVSLACDISPHSPEDSVALILWYKDDSMAPIFTLDARKDSQLERAKLTIDDAYAKRASFSQSSKPAQLQLEQLRLEDEGEYRCRVDFKRGRSVNTIISLRVIVPPEDLRIVNPLKPNQRLEGHIGPYSEGQELILLCKASGGKPRPQIKWRHDFSVIDETYQRLDKEGTSNELRIPALTRSHLLSKFTCIANNSVPLHTDITLDLYLKPLEINVRQVNPPIEDSQQQQMGVVGQNVTFECVTSGSRPHATIYWLFQGVRHEPTTEFQQQQSLSRLTLTLQRSFNKQPLTCVAQNERLAGVQSQNESSNNNKNLSPDSQTSIRYTLRLDVQYAPQLSIRLDPQGTSAGDQQHAASALAMDTYNQPASLSKWPQEGNDIYLTCQLDANPRPQKPVLWRHNGRLLGHSNTAANQPQASTIVMSNQSLVIRKISRSQGGLYACEASNSLGSNSSQSLELVVRHAPVCSTDDILTYEAALGQILTIDCQVTANPAKSVHFSWFRSPIESNISAWLQRDASLDEQIDDSSQLLRLKIKDRNSFGQFKCKAKNEIGLQQRPCLFQVIESPAPKMRHSCRVLSHQTRANSLTLQCEPSDHLRTDESELSGAAGSAGSSLVRPDPSALLMGGFGAGLEPHSLGTALTDTMPRARLIHPPRWLLVELHKIHSQPAQLKITSTSMGAAKTTLNQMTTAADTASTSSMDTSELVAYVIVAATNQLASIKALVESSQIFKSQPRSIYYVMTRPLEEGASNSTTSANGGFKQPPLNDLDLFSNKVIYQFRPDLLHKDNNNNPLPFPFDHHHQQANQGGELNVIEDPSIQLATQFRFIIPNLEPETKYKLLIFAQNLASRTRDWISLRADTTGPEPVPSSRVSSTSYSNNRPTPSELDTENLTRERDDNTDQQHESLLTSLRNQTNSSQKSLVMRSDQQQQGPSSSDLTDSAPSSFISSPAPNDQVDQQVGSSSSKFRFLEEATRKWPLAPIKQQMTVYTDKVLLFARQKPLLALPAAGLALILLLMSLIWLIGQLSQRAKRNQPDRQHHNEDNSSGAVAKQEAARLDHRRRRSTGSSTSETEASPDLDTDNNNDDNKSPDFRGDKLAAAQMDLKQDHDMRMHLESSNGSGGVFTIALPTINSNNSSSGYNSSGGGGPPNRSKPQAAYLLNWAGPADQLAGALGSLDRRTVLLAQHHHQSNDNPYQLASNQNHNQFNSIDRSQWPALHHQQQQHDHQQAPSSKRAPAHQRTVAFDLSPYDTSVQQQQQQQQHGCNKGSDSGASNSNQTADSGHESPPTHGGNHTGSSICTSSSTRTISGDNNQRQLINYNNQSLSAGLRNHNIYSHNNNNHRHHHLVNQNSSSLLLSEPIVDLVGDLVLTANGQPVSLATSSSISSVACSPAASERLATASVHLNGAVGPINCHQSPTTTNGLLMLAIDTLAQGGQLEAGNGTLDHSLGSLDLSHLQHNHQMATSFHRATPTTFGVSHSPKDHLTLEHFPMVALQTSTNQHANTNLQPEAHYHHIHDGQELQAVHGYSKSTQSQPCDQHLYTFDHQNRHQTNSNDHPSQSTRRRKLLNNQISSQNTSRQLVANDHNNNHHQGNVSPLLESSDLLPENWL